MIDRFLVPMSNLNRLVAEYKKYGSLTIGFDFDDTVHDFHKQGHSYEMVRQLLRDLKSIGCTLVCWTAHYDPDVYVPEFLTTNNIPFDYINEGSIPLKWESKKPFFSALLDDRAGLEQMYNDLTMLVHIINSEKQANNQQSPITL